MCCYVAEQVTHWLCVVWLRCVEVRREPSSQGFSFNGIKSHRKLISWVRLSSFLKRLKHGKLNPKGENKCSSGSSLVPVFTYGYDGQGAHTFGCIGSKSLKKQAGLSGV